MNEDIMNMSANPFMGMITNMANSGQQPPQRMQGNQASGMHKMPNGQMMRDSEMIEGSDYEDPATKQLEKGGNPSQSANLMKAVSALEAFAADSTDKNDIALIRGVLSALARLMGKNQDGLRALL